MKALIEVTPTAEQLALLPRTFSGVEIIRGAAGSGKTTTALLKLRAAVGFYLNRSRRQKSQKPVEILLLTFNRTLCGYVTELAKQQINQGSAIDMQISTFSRWTHNLLDANNVLDQDDSKDILKHFSKNTQLDPDFAADEAAYVLGRFTTEKLNNYLSTRRDGRGTTPRMERLVREVLLNEVIYPYLQHKKQHALLDWNDLALRLVHTKLKNHDVIIVDEAQDFSANEIRTILN